MSELSRQERDVSGFHRISTSGIGNLVIEPGDTESLVIEAHPEVIPQIKSEVRNGTLSIEFKPLGWLRRPIPTGPINYYLTVTELDGIKISGACKATVARMLTDKMDLSVSGAGKISIELEADELETSISGTGKIQASGRVDRQSLRISGAGNYSAQELDSKQCQIRVSGAGKSTVIARETLDVVISGSGLVEYQGQPTVTKRVSGVGRVTPITQ